jgi:hypothetical protein
LTNGHDDSDFAMFQLGRSILQSVYRNNIPQIALDWLVANIFFFKIVQKFFNWRTSARISIDDKRDNRRAGGASHDRTPSINRSDLEMMPNIVREKRGKPFDLPLSFQPIHGDALLPQTHQ